MTRGQWPVDHDGTGPDDLPYDYSMFPTLFDDKRGYAPLVVGHGMDDTGRETIMVALSPGSYLSATVISAGEVPGQDPGMVVPRVQGTIQHLGDGRPYLPTAGQPNSF